MRSPSTPCVIAAGMAALFTGGMLLGGPALFRFMGGRDGALAAAVSYSTVIFTGAVAFWMFNILGSIVRGTGNMILPAAVVVGGGIVVVPLSPMLIYGAGPLPALGVRGAGLAMVTYYVLGSAVLAALSPFGTRPRPTGWTMAGSATDPVLGHSPRGGARRVQHHPDQPHADPSHRVGGSLRHGGAGRLWHGGAARVSRRSRSCSAWARRS